jgi:hypothetical protein
MTGADFCPNVTFEDNEFKDNKALTLRPLWGNLGSWFLVYNIILTQRERRPPKKKSKMTFKKKKNGRRPKKIIEDNLNFKAVLLRLFNNNLKKNGFDTIEINLVDI